MEKAVSRGEGGHGSLLFFFFSFFCNEQKRGRNKEFMVESLNNSIGSKAEGPAACVQVDGQI